MKNYSLVIDYKYCTGCHSCEVACRAEKGIVDQDKWGIKFAEFGPERMGEKWYWNYVPVPSNLCDMCEDRLARGEDAACEHHCLAKCMFVVPNEKIGEKLAELGGEGVAVFQP